MENYKPDKPIEGQMSIEELMTSSESRDVTKQYRVVLKQKKGNNYKKRTEIVRELAASTGVCVATVYNYAKRLGRLPTADEIKKGRRLGRPPKYTSQN